MLDPVSQPNAASGETKASVEFYCPKARNKVARRRVVNRPAANPSASDQQSVEHSVIGSQSVALVSMDRPPKKETPKHSKRRALPNNFILKRLDTLYWRRLLRYLYIRFLRMQSSPNAIARGVAAGAFAGSFPLLGAQTLIGIALASVIRGNKVMAAASTWISNPLTYVPLFALNFHIGRLLLRLPPVSELPTSPTGINGWMAMGMDVAGALMLGSLVVGIVFGIVGYYIGLNVAQRVRKAKAARKPR